MREPLGPWYHVDVIECVFCHQVFKMSDPVTKCPNSATGAHSLKPHEEKEGQK